MVAFTVVQVLTVEHVDVIIKVETVGRASYSSTLRLERFLWDTLGVLCGQSDNNNWLRLS